MKGDRWRKYIFPLTKVQILYFCAMKPDFLYSTDFLAMNAPELSHTCMHLLCTAGEGSFVFNEKCYHIGKNDLVVMPNPTRAKNLAAAPGMQVEWFAADRMNFTSLSYFSRYCTKHLGQSPSEYRKSLQPRG